MKRKKIFTLILTLTVGVLILSMIEVGCNRIYNLGIEKATKWKLEYFDLNRIEIKNAKILETITSPNGTYEITSYLREGDSLVRESILVQLKIGDETKNIFYDYPIREVEMKWIDENTVEINGIILDVRTDTYDWRED